MWHSCVFISLLQGDEGWPGATGKNGLNGEMVSREENGGVTIVKNSYHAVFYQQGKLGNIGEEGPRGPQGPKVRAL